MATAAAVAMQHATTALLERRERLAHQVITGDAEIDALRARVEEVATDALLFHAPGRGRPAGRGGGDPRRRVTWSGWATSRCTSPRSPSGRGPCPPTVCADFAEMGRLAVAMARKAAEVARTRNVLLAVELAGDDDAMDGCTGTCSPCSWTRRGPHGVPAAVDLTLLARYYERYADHAVLVAREVVYAVTGQTPDAARALAERPET